MPDELEGRVNRLQAQIEATTRVFKRILDLDDNDDFDRSFLVGIRNALAYAVTMKGREQDTEAKLRWVEGKMQSEVEQKKKNNGYIRMLIAAALPLILAGFAGLIALHWK